ncbi:MAG: ATP-dependent DNA helicase RecG [Acidimicrobiales bacterium]
MARRLEQLAAIPVTELKGVGPERARALGKLGIESVLDLLTHYPRRYLDRTKEARIADLRIGDEATVLVRVVRVNARRTRSRTTLVTADVTDGSGHLRLTFFNQPWRQSQLRPGLDALIFGKVDTYGGRRQMTNPVVDLIGDKTGRIIPVYPQSEKEKINTWDIARWMDEVLDRAGDFLDPVPDDVVDEVDLIDRTSAFRGIHTSESMDEVGAARRRLVFDELLRIQLALVLRKQVLERTASGIRHDTSGELVRRFVDRLPYQLTAGQQAAIDEIVADLGGPHPMHRLLQGDVGSGKTTVAVAAMLTAVQGGHQAALMAPTEVLAEQHALGVRQRLSGFTVPVGEEAGQLFDERPLTVELLTNRTTPTQRDKLFAGLADGTVDLVIGTHALIEEGVRFRSLGVVVIDEQHRFGVEQRATLREKGADGLVPDVLVMTATPIPRTAAMTVYGDLDVTTLAEKPGERQPIATVWEKTAAHETGQLSLGELAVWGHVRREVEAGHQAYVVCPLIEESEKLEVRSAEATYAELEAGPLSGLRLGLLHGRIRPAEKEATMELFRAGQLDVLVATTVIEVGVDVPNATVMVILDADRFGIAQLHQLRGRVGRGADKSWCYLVGAGSSPDGERRLAALVDSDDGFALAEVDLEVRGEGTLFAARQKGRNDLKLASLLRDRPVVERARAIAFRLVDRDPGLHDHPELLAEVELFLDEDERAFLQKS